MKQVKISKYVNQNGDTYEVVQDRCFVERKGFCNWQVEFRRSCGGIIVGSFWLKSSAIDIAKRINWIMKDIEIHDCHEFETTGVGPKQFHDFEVVEVVQ